MMMNERMFWESVKLATANPRLYKTRMNWNRFLRESQFWEMHDGLVNYFGCSEDQARL